MQRSITSMSVAFLVLMLATFEAHPQNKSSGQRSLEANDHDGEKAYIFGCTVAVTFGIPVCDELPGNHAAIKKMEEEDDYYAAASSKNLKKDDRTAFQKRLSEGRLRLRRNYIPPSSSDSAEVKGK